MKDGTFHVRIRMSTNAVSRILPIVEKLGYIKIKKSSKILLSFSFLNLKKR